VKLLKIYKWGLGPKDQASICPSQGLHHAIASRVPKVF
jgi:hypothetical protein